METTPPEKLAEAIGAFILDCGAAEVATFQWITVLGTDLMLRDVAIDMPFRKRIRLVCQLIERSNHTEAEKLRAIALWQDVERIADTTRNKIAHSPLCRNPNGSGEWGFIDVKKMKGSGPYQVEPLCFDAIMREGSKLASILPELFNVLGSTKSGKGSNPS
jgi:hypothetical protein